MRIAVDDRDAWVVQALAPALGGMVIDLGCGDGGVGVLLERAGVRPARLLGVDILEERLAAARTAVPWGEFLLSSADALPVADGSASAVVAMTLFSSLTDDWFMGRVASEIDRVLEPGGHLVVYDLRFPSPTNRHVRPISGSMLRHSFPGWPATSRSMTLLPPLARSSLAAGDRRYRALAAVPLLRSHLGSILVKPD
jgi:ubiquinone/menaquinone biosynthesis C-methylase UbiE